MTEENKSTPKLSTIALWVGIAGGLAAVYFPVRSEIQADQKAREVYQRAQLERTAQAQKDWGLLLHRLSNDEAAIAFLEAQMPKDKREILDAISLAQQQAQAQEQQAPLIVTKAMRRQKKEDNQMLEQPKIRAAKKERKPE